MAKYDFNSLNHEEMIYGAQACIDNAKRLMQAANLLSEGSFPELATFAVCTAIEEIGKALLLLDYQEKKSQGKDDGAKNLNASFKEHFPKFKTALTTSEQNRKAIGLMIETFFSTDIPEADFRNFWKKINALTNPNVAELVTDILSRRQDMIYIDYKNGRFTSPIDMAQKNDFDNLVHTSNLVIAQAKRDLAKVRAGCGRGSFQEQATEAIKHEFKKR